MDLTSLQAAVTEIDEVRRKYASWGSFKGLHG